MQTDRQTDRQADRQTDFDRQGDRKRLCGLLAVLSHLLQTQKEKVPSVTVGLTLIISAMMNAMTLILLS